MSPVTADILTFFAFSVVWLFPIGIIIAVLGFSHADSKNEKEELGPNVIPFPAREPNREPEPTSWINRIKRLAIPSQGR